MESLAVVILNPIAWVIAIVAAIVLYGHWKRTAAPHSRSSTAVPRCRQTL
jgi:hypothetical protein